MKRVFATLTLALAVVLSTTACDLFNSSIIAPTKKLPPDPATEHKLVMPPTEASPSPAPPDTPTVPPSEPVPHGAGTTEALGLCRDLQQGLSCLVLIYNDFGMMVKTTNSSAETQLASLTTYALGVDPDDFASQRVHDPSDTKLIPPGESVLLSVNWPEPSEAPCGAQADAYTGDKQNHPPHRDGTLLGYEKRVVPCTPPPPPPPPDPDPTPDPPKTGCEGVRDVRWGFSQDQAIVYFTILPGYAIKLWAAGYARIDWEHQRYLGGSSAVEEWWPGAYTISVPLQYDPLYQGDLWCSPEHTQANVTPENHSLFDAMHDRLPNAYTLGNTDSIPQRRLDRLW